MTDIPALRRHIKQQRQALSAEQRDIANHAIFEQVISLPQYRNAQHIAAYIGTRGEIDALPILKHAYSLGKQCYLPVLHPFFKGRLWFAPWSPNTFMTRNRFDILEPLYKPSTCIKAQHLNIVLTPLLAFDGQGHRLGMGGGFYDRSFNFRLFRKKFFGPELIGLGHHFQQVDVIDAQPWDVSLDSVISF